VRVMLTVAAIFSVILWHCPWEGKASAGARKADFFLNVAGLQDGSLMPPHFACDGAGVSLPVSWSGEPEGTC